MWMISGTRDRSFLAGLLAGLMFLAAGCQVVQITQPQPPDRVDATPIVEDPAMLARAWPPTPAIYPNLSSTTGPCEMLLVPRDDLKPATHAALETPVFVADLLLMPVVVIEGILPPPWAQVEGTSFYLPPTYTSNPPTEAVHHTDYSGGTGIGYDPAPGRVVGSP
jgi:hypothetical protein